TESYTASKGGVSDLTHALALSLAPDIRVNSISPGWIEVEDWKKSRIRKTPVHTEEDKRQHPAGRVGIPMDVASTVLFLIDEKNGFVTGQNFTVDGGMTRKMIYV
ncbi:MAG: SDR family oxidoreductase, partial [Fibrobacterota bacterium]